MAGGRVKFIPYQVHPVEGPERVCAVQSQGSRAVQGREGRAKDRVRVEV